MFTWWPVKHISIWFLLAHLAPEKRKHTRRFFYLFMCGYIQIWRICCWFQHPTQIDGSMAALLATCPISPTNLATPESSLLLQLTSFDIHILPLGWHNIFWLKMATTLTTRSSGWCPGTMTPTTFGDTVVWLQQQFNVSTIQFLTD